MHSPWLLCVFCDENGSTRAYIDVVGQGHTVGRHWLLWRSGGAAPNGSGGVATADAARPLVDGARRAGLREP